MIVVAIIGILSAVGIPSYLNYLNRSRTSEAITFLAEIKARQESYRTEYGQYVNTTINFYPDTGAFPLGDVTRPFGTLANPLPTEWRDLLGPGSSGPGTQVRFSYRTVTGLLGTTPDSVLGTGDLGYDGTDLWFVSQAIGDLDGDGELVTFEGYSHKMGIWCDEAGGWE
jgi:type IV pilus assembly protein PilA